MRGSSSDESTHIGPSGDRLVAGIITLLVVVSFVMSAVALGGGGVVGASNGLALQESDEFEPNDGFDTAHAVTAPFTNDDLRTGAEDEDYFAVDLSKGDRLDVSVRFDHEAGDVDLIVYDPNRDQVAQNLSFDDDEQVSLQAGRAGTYYVQILGWAEEGTDYSLVLERSDGTLPSNDRFEYNDGFASATELEVSSGLGDLQLPVDDRDVYAVTAPSGTELEVFAGFTHDVSDVDLVVYNTSQAPIRTGLSNTDNETVSFPVTGEGPYYVEVYSENGSHTSYSLSVERTSGTPVEATDEATDDIDTATVTASPSATATATTQAGPETATATLSPSAPDTADTESTSAGGPGFTALAGVLAIGGLLAGRWLLESGATQSGSDTERDSP